MPTRDFKSVVSVLEKMLNFMKMTSVGTLSSNKGIKVKCLHYKKFVIFYYQIFRPPKTL